MKLVALVGSVRKESYNQQIANYMKNRYKDVLDIEMLNMKDLPYFDQDVEQDPPEVVKEFKKKIKESDAVLIVTPEYNHSLPGILKNALDWTSRVDYVVNGKPVLIVGASPGLLGTVRCQIHLRQILNAPGMGARVMPGNEVFIGMVHEKVDENGNIIDEPTNTFLDTVVDNFVTFHKNLLVNAK